MPAGRERVLSDDILDRVAGELICSIGCWKPATVTMLVTVAARPSHRYHILLTTHAMTNTTSAKVIWATSEPM